MEQLLDQTLELKPGETTTQMMFYTSKALIWGSIVHHENILASRILTGVTIPEYVSLHNAQIMFVQMNYMGKPMRRKEIFLPADQINAYHLTPPQEDQLDYDPTEPNRMMSPLEIYQPPFTIKANIRISQITTVKSNLTALKSDFITFYDAETTISKNPNMKPICTNMILVRSKASFFTTN
jgi:hypothetical protein